ncbi:MAG: zinc ribbon domain-containing protein [Deltaproteobacteria bacterium]|nr:zinc ribbon domain-containing protein [Deltaproteobacteria bacterium]MBW2050743.1 zinc ribbon domain-containing protein [Deltaproteobacteria bacterium]MBW2140454.1 zinc ribbon domain-containing protein [Deltaproteobacteria bacterium]
MPIYEFRCLACDEVFEFLFMSDKDENEMKCPHCQGEELERVLSRTNHTISGSSQESQVNVSTKDCASGSCATIEIPGGYD